MRSKRKRVSKVSNQKSTHRTLPLTSAGRVWTQWIGLAAAMAIGMVLHYGALRMSFFADDYLFLEQARSGSLIEVLTAPDPIGNYFRPVSRQLWFWLVTRASGGNPFGFHLANLATFALTLALFAALLRSWLGARPAIVGCLLLAVHHSADVPIMWASGSQDLLAVAAAIGAILLTYRGHVFFASAVFLLALLSKETVVFTPLVASLIGRRSHEGVRDAIKRVWPLYGVLLVMVPVWVSVAAIGRMESPLTLPPAHALIASQLHLLQTAVGYERLAGSPFWPVQVPPWPVLLLVALALSAALLVPDRASGRSDMNQSAHSQGWPAFTGVLWALCGALPITLVVESWSAYHFLFSICGVAIAAAAVTTRGPWWVAWVVVLTLTFTAHNARLLPAFSAKPDAWSSVSHLNEFYLSRGSAIVQQLLAELRRARPTLDPGSTLFFTGIPAKSGFQVGDGTLVRWAYADTSLRAHFLGQFALHYVRRGPVIFFEAGNSRPRLREIVGPDSLERIGLSLVLSEHLDPARDIHILAWQRSDASARLLAYRLAWIEAARGRRDSTALWLSRCGLVPQRGGAPTVADVLAKAGGGGGARLEVLRDAVARHVLDPYGHAALADVLLRDRASAESGVFEALAARVLNPKDPRAWRRWAIVQAQSGKVEQGRANLERYLAMAGDSARRGDLEALKTLKRLGPEPDFVGPVRR